MVFEPTDPDLDTDQDGLTDTEESALGTDPNNPDSDEMAYLTGKGHAGNPPKPPRHR